jgi:catechol 2,3-dioxygenase-like lactoylglutathione lyase family enzyme
MVANGRTVAPVRRVLAGIIGTIGVFVIFFGAGRASWATVALGVALLILAIGLVAVNAVRGGGRAWIAGTGHVLTVSEPPANSAVGRCELRIVIDAPGLPAAAVKLRDPRVPVAKWPDPGATLPVLVAVDDLRHVRIQWDDVLTHAEAADDEQLQVYEEEVRVEPAVPDPDDDTVIVTERVSTVDDPVRNGTLDLTDDVERVREDEWRSAQPARESDREPVIITQTPAGPVVEGRLVERGVAGPDPEPGRAEAAVRPRPEPDSEPTDEPTDERTDDDPAGSPVGGTATPTGSTDTGGDARTGGAAAGGIPSPRRRPSPRPRRDSPRPDPSSSPSADLQGGRGPAGSAATATATGAAGAATAATAGAAVADAAVAGTAEDRSEHAPKHLRDELVGAAALADNSDELADLITAYPSARPGPTGSIYGVGITVLVTDLDRSIAFYRDMLGFFEIDGGDGNAVLASGDTRLVLRQIPDVSGGNRRVVHLNLEVGDVEVTYEELRGKGVKFTYAPRAVNKGERLELWAAAFQDPDGHGIAITQWRSRPAG